MQGKNYKCLIWLKSVLPGPALEVNTTTEKGANDKGVFSVKRCFTYTLGSRHLNFEIIKIGYANCVNNVYLNLCEKNGKGSSVDLNMQVMRSDQYGVLCKMHSKFSGSFSLSKDRYCVPPLPNTEILHYECRETDIEGFFSLEKRVSKDFVERVKATHAFVVGDETINVKIKITYDKKIGLNVEVEDPLKLTVDYMKRVSLRTEEKMESEMTEGMISLYRNAISSEDSGRGGRQCVTGTVHTTNIELPKHELPDQVLC